MDESVVKHLEQPEVGTLKLSEAIRIGAKIRPQCKEAYFANGASCAVGAAYEAITGKYESHKGLMFWAFWAFDNLGIDQKLLLQITRMNDQEGKTREEIADWLESQGR